MSETNSEQNRNLWAPWRMEYIDSLSAPSDGCFLCHHRDHADDDAKNYVLWRGRRSFVVLNRFPYTGGHSMVAPFDHVADLSEVDDETMLEMIQLLRDLQRALTHAVRAEGFNIGINIGRCAGAGLPGHLHIHIVPRWSGDTNFMAVFGGVRVIPQSLDALYEALRKSSDALKLPHLKPRT
jgi:ATP adenylyltransferase